MWIDKYCPELRRRYDAFPTGIHRADLFRIMTLYYEGGVYADVDIECIRPLDELLSHLSPDKSVFLTRDHPVHERIHFRNRAMYMNDFMIARPKDPLIGAILQWMLNSPPPVNNASASAVMDTGPGVVSSVIEMLRGSEILDGLECMPVGWIHPLPDMNCRFEEFTYYEKMINSRQWLKQDVFVVHYWFHTWVGVEGNTLTRSSDVLLSTFGEQVERRLQWLLTSDVSEVEAIIASAIVEAVEKQCEFVLLGDAPGKFIEKFLTILKSSGVRPVLKVCCSHSDFQNWTAHPDASSYVLKHQPIASGVSEKRCLLVAENQVDVAEFVAQTELIHGFLLGPKVPNGEIILEHGEHALSEITNETRRPPRVIHFLPGQQVEPELGEIIKGPFETKYWNVDEINELILNQSYGLMDTSLIGDEEFEILAVLSILSKEGGVVFRGELEILQHFLEEKQPHNKYLYGEDSWLLSISRDCEVVDNALVSWEKMSRGSLVVDLKEFIRLRIETLNNAGLIKDLDVEKFDPFEFSI